MVLKKVTYRRFWDKKHKENWENTEKKINDFWLTSFTLSCCMKHRLINHVSINFSIVIVYRNWVYFIYTYTYTLAINQHVELMKINFTFSCSLFFSIWKKKWNEKNKRVWMNEVIFTSINSMWIYSTSIQREMKGKFSNENHVVYGWSWWKLEGILMRDSKFGNSLFFSFNLKSVLFFRRLSSDKITEIELKQKKKCLNFLSFSELGWASDNNTAWKIEGSLWPKAYLYIQKSILSTHLLQKSS